MTAADIARALGGRKNGPGWTAKCPAHEDRSPSLSFRDADGKILVHCHAGCGQDEVIAALRGRGLWPEADRPVRTPADRARWAEEQRWIDRNLRDALYWRRGAVLMVEQSLDAMKASLFDPQAAPLAVGEIADVTRLLESLRRKEGAVLVEEYLSWCEREPRITQGLVWCMRRRERAEVRALARYILA